MGKYFIMVVEDMGSWVRSWVCGVLGLGCRAVGATKAWTGSIPKCHLGFKVTPQTRSDPDPGAGINPWFCSTAQTFPTGALGSS